MIKKTCRGYEVKAKTGRTMGIYPSKDLADKRLKQIESFKLQATKRLHDIRQKKKKK